jgi:hypothetical protein
MVVNWSFEVRHKKGQVVFVRVPTFSTKVTEQDELTENDEDTTDSASLSSTSSSRRSKRKEKEKEKERKKEKELDLSLSLCVFRPESRESRNAWILQLKRAMSLPFTDFPCTFSAITSISHPRPESCVWLNHVLRRYFHDMLANERFRTLVHRKVQVKFDRIRLPNFVGPLSLTNVNLGRSILNLQSIDVCLSTSLVLFLCVYVSVYVCGVVVVISTSCPCGCWYVSFQCVCVCVCVYKFYFVGTTLSLSNSHICTNKPTFTLPLNSTHTTLTHFHTAHRSGRWTTTAGN